MRFRLDDLEVIDAESWPAQGEMPVVWMVAREDRAEPRRPAASSAEYTRSSFIRS
jgi:hypothetical protein